MRERHIRRLKLNSRAQLLLLQLTLTSKDFSRVTGVISVQTDCAARWCPPPLVCTNDVFDPCGQVLHMHTFLSTWVQHSTLMQRKLQHSSLLSPLQLLQSLLWVCRELQWTHFLSGWCHLGIMPKLPWTKNVHAWGQWHVRICKPLLFNTSLSCFPVCVSVFSEESSEDLFHQRSKVFKAAMWSHAKMILITVFVFG